MIGDEGICKVPEDGIFAELSQLAGLFFNVFFFIFGEVANGVDLVIGKEVKNFLIGFLEVSEDMFLRTRCIIEVLFGEYFEKAFIYFFEDLHFTVFLVVHIDCREEVISLVGEDVIEYWIINFMMGEVGEAT